MNVNKPSYCQCSFHLVCPLNIAFYTLDCILVFSSTWYKLIHGGKWLAHLPWHTERMQNSRFVAGFVDRRRKCLVWCCASPSRSLIAANGASTSARVWQAMHKSNHNSRCRWKFPTNKRKKSTLKQCKIPLF